MKKAIHLTVATVLLSCSGAKAERQVEPSMLIKEKPGAQVYHPDHDGTPPYGARVLLPEDSSQRYPGENGKWDIKKKEVRVVFDDQALSSPE